MSKTITIAPVTRIEGHAKVTIQLDDAGNVADTQVNVVELRGFEKFCLGRPVEELPRIVTSIGLDAKQVQDRRAVLNRYIGAQNRLRPLPQKPAVQGR